MARLAVLAAMLCGCAQLLGLDETTGGPPEASLVIERVSIGARVTRSPQDLSGSMATYLVPAEVEPTGLTRAPAIQVEPGRWSAPITAPAPLLFDLPDYPKPILRLFDFPRAEVKAVFSVLEHPNPQPAPMGATLNVSVTLDAAVTGVAGERFELFTLGAWSSAGLTAPAIGTTGPLVQAVQLVMGNSLTGRPLEKITTDDAVVVLRYLNTNQLRGALRAAPFEQTGTDAITGTMTTVDIQQTTVEIDQASVMQRYSAVRPPVGALEMRWTLRAAPGAQYNQDLGPILNTGVAATPTTLDVQAGNPFAPDWPSTLLWLTQGSRMYTPPSAGLPATLLANMHERALLAQGLQMRLAAGLPRGVTIGGISLDTDGAMLPRPSRAVEVTFTTEAPHTLYQLQLLKLVPNAGNTALVPESKLSANGAAPRFVLPSELLEPGGLYTLRVGAVEGGFPGIAGGDLTQRSIPIAIAFVDSGVFQVLP